GGLCFSQRTTADVGSRAGALPKLGVPQHRSQSSRPGGTGGARAEASPASAIFHFVFLAKRGSQAAPSGSVPGSGRSGANALAASPLADPSGEIRGPALSSALAPPGGETSRRGQNRDHLDRKQAPPDAASGGMGRGWDYLR